MNKRHQEEMKQELIKSRNETEGKKTSAMMIKL